MFYFFLLYLSPKCIIATVNGTTGEGMSLSVNERKLLAREWVEKARGKWVGTHFIYALSFMQGLVLFIYWFWHVWILVCTCLNRMDEVIVHIGCTSLKESQELVSCLRPALKTALQLLIKIVIVHVSIKFLAKLINMIYYYENSLTKFKTSVVFMLTICTQLFRTLHTDNTLYIATLMLYFLKLS